VIEASPIREEEGGYVGTKELACSKPNSVTLSSSLAGSRARQRPACARRVHVAGQIPLRCLSCDLLASWSQTTSEQDSVM